MSSALGTSARELLSTRPATSHDRTSVPPPPTTTSGSALVAALGVVLIAADVDLVAGATAGTLLALGLSPVWLPTAARYRGFRWLLGLALLGAGTGVLLTGLAASDHATSGGLLLEQLLVLAGFVAATGWFLWSRRHLQPWTIAALFGIGVIASIRPDAGMFADNPWKFGLSVPVTLIALALAWRTGRRWLGAAFAVVLGAATALSDGRSLFAMLALTAMLVVWQGRKSAVSRPRSVLRILFLLAGLIYVGYSVGQALILEGYLGAETQLRTQTQIQTSGSLILGGRPEAAASAALIRESPLGYGAGTIPSVGDILVAKSAMAGINYDPNNGYVENYMFGRHFEVHSILGDLWIWYGPAGALLAVAIFVIAVHGAARRIAGRTASALELFLCAWTLWNVAFSPFLTSAPTTALTIALLLTVAREGDRTESLATPRKALA
jgi:hypothetical protein